MWVKPKLAAGEDGERAGAGDRGTGKKPTPTAEKSHEQGPSGASRGPVKPTQQHTEHRPGRAGGDLSARSAGGPLAQQQALFQVDQVQGPNKNATNSNSPKSQGGFQR